MPVDALQDAASCFPVARPPLQDLIGRGMTIPLIHFEPFFQEGIDILWNRILGKYLGVAQTKQKTSRRLHVAVDSAGTQILLLQLCAQLLDVCLIAFERRPTPLCNTKQMVNRCGVIGSPMSFGSCGLLPCRNRYARRCRRRYCSRSVGVAAFNRIFRASR